MRRFIVCILILLMFAGVTALWAQATRPTIPTPATYNYTEANGCAACHFTRGASAWHMPWTVGVTYNATKNIWDLTGGGWLASRHSQTNYKSTQNTFCTTCHSPLEAKPSTSMTSNQPVADGKMQGVTCAACHPGHTVAAALGRRLGIYQIGKDPATAAGYKVVEEGEEDLLCLNCHVERHNESDEAFRRMYNAGVRCIDCHMAVVGYTTSGAVEVRAHDFKVAANLPYSCGVDGSVHVCHPGYSAQETLSYIPILKGQHSSWWPKSGGSSAQSPAQQK